LILALYVGQHSALRPRRLNLWWELRYTQYLCLRNGRNWKGRGEGWRL